MKKLGIVLLVIVLIGAIMLVTNPNEERFNNYLVNKYNRNINKYTSGSKGAVDKIMETGEPDLFDYTKLHYDRNNLYILSIYETNSTAIKSGTKYVGMFMIFFEME